MAKPPFDTLFLAGPGETDYISQRCIESLVEMPEVMQEADQVEALNPKTQADVEAAQQSVISLLRRAARLDEKLRIWRAELGEAISPPLPSQRAIGIQDESFGPPRLAYRDWKDSYLWTLFWTMTLYVHELIKQLQACHAHLAARLPSTSAPARAAVTLPPDLAILGEERQTLDKYAENICGSVFAGFDSSPFAAQEAMVGIFTAQWYYSTRGDTERLKWCVRIMRIIENHGLTLGVEVDERPGLAPLVWARFLEDEALVRSTPPSAKQSSRKGNMEN